MPTSPLTQIEFGGISSRSVKPHSRRETKRDEGAFRPPPDPTVPHEPTRLRIIRRALQPHVKSARNGAALRIRMVPGRPPQKSWMPVPRHCALLLMLILVMGVVGREFPELLELADDNSNEGIVVGCKDQLPSLSSRPLLRPEKAVRASNQFVTPGILSGNHYWFGPSLDASTRSGHGILAFLSCRRT